MIVATVLFKNKGNKKFWNLFEGIFIASIIGTVLSLSQAVPEEGGLNEAIGGLLVSALQVISLAITIVICTISVKNMPKESKRFGAVGGVACAAAVLVNVFAIYGAPSIANSSAESQFGAKAIELVTAKYGDQDYKVLDVEKSYSDNGIISRSHTGYIVKLEAQKLNYEFDFRVYGTNISNANHFSDRFVETYYEEKLKNTFGDDGKIEPSLSIDDRDIPNDYGHFPTIDELEELDAISYMYLDVYATINNYEKYDNYTTRQDNIKTLAFELADALAIEKHAYIEFRRYRNDGNYTYRIEIERETIKIIDDSDRTYEYSRITGEEI